MTDNSPLAAALRYAKMGFQVFPVQAKRPLTPNGFLDSSGASDVIKAWWEEHPDRGVAIRIPPDCVVVDLDLIGEKSLAEFGHTLPSTSCCKTKRGRHHWFELGDSKPDKVSRRIAHLPDVDILVNGYVCVPPTPGYEWEVEPLRKNIEKAPEWVVVAIAEDHAKREGMSDDDFQNGLPAGSRQTGLFRRACRLRHKGNSKGEAKAILRDLAARSGSADYDTDALVDRVYRTYDEAASREDEEEQLKVWTLADLLSEHKDPPLFLVDGLLPVGGYTLLSAPQGAGKSALAGQVAACVATGAKLWGRAVEPGAVLVLDIEQNDKGAASRWRKLLRGLGLQTVPGGLYLAFDWPPVIDGGLERIADFVAEHPAVRLVVIDTLGDLKGESTGGDAYQSDTKEMRKFTRLAKDYGISLLTITHDRKTQGGVKDAFSDRASGSRAIPGKALARWNLQRHDFEPTGVLLASGKNIPEAKINLTFDTDTMSWR